MSLIHDKNCMEMNNKIGDDQAEEFKWLRIDEDGRCKIKLLGLSVCIRDKI